MYSLLYLYTYYSLQPHLKTHKVSYSLAISIKFETEYPPTKQGKANLYS